ncbi:MAG: uracil phosphoribosyltransferase [Planctomycetota bacterium]
MPDAGDTATPSPIPLSVTVIEHPILAHWLTVLRDRSTPAPRFRAAMGMAGALLAYEATRDLLTTDAPVETPLERHIGKRLAQHLTVVPILRAGMGLADRLLEWIPGSHMGHLGMFRDEASLEPVSYYEKLPSQVDHGPVLLVDPMLATGGSAAASVGRLKDRGCTDIRFLCLVASPEGLSTLEKAHPGTPVFTAAIDRGLDANGYIRPGLGDAGDRVFGTIA